MYLYNEAGRSAEKYHMFKINIVPSGPQWALWWPSRHYRVLELEGLGSAYSEVTPAGAGGRVNLPIR